MKRLLTLALVVALPPLGAVRGDNSDEKKSDVPTIVKGNNEFAFDLYAKLASEQKGKNLFFSPYSVSTALAMTYAGARGDTEKEMAKTLRFSLGQEKLHPAFRELRADLDGGGKKRRYELVTANALWGHKGHKFLPAFLKTMKDDYDGGLREVDFVKGTEQARKTINGWVEKQTKDRVKELLPEGVLDENTRLVLTNAIYFKAGWQNPFKKRSTSKADFHVTTDKKVSVMMMNHDANFPHYRDKGFQVLELPYLDDQLSMVVLLPNAADGLAEFEKTLTVDEVNGWLAKMKKTRVMVSLPRFEVSSEFALNEVLKKMGMRKAFTKEANFSGIDGKEDLFVQAVMHKAFVKVDEEGTEAAGATSVVIGLLSLPPQFKADHPFVFLIRHKASGSILFLGRVVEPK